jgi:predicted TIM-barrel fold metal-dependent hydrolase
MLVACFADDVGLAEAIEYLGAEHGNVVFSSDWPHQSLDDLDSSSECLRRREDLTDAAKSQILEGNASPWLNV